MVITVTSVNDAPTAYDDVGETDEGTAVPIPVLDNDTDPENDTLSVQGVTNPQNGTTVISGSEVIYTPDDGFYGVDMFSYTVWDGGLTDTAVVTIMVVGVPLNYIFLPVIISRR